MFNINKQKILKSMFVNATKIPFSTVSLIIPTIWFYILDLRLLITLIFIELFGQNAEKLKHGYFCKPKTIISTSNKDTFML